MVILGHPEQGFLTVETDSRSESVTSERKLHASAPFDFVVLMGRPEQKFSSAENDSRNELMTPEKKSDASTHFDFVVFLGLPEQQFLINIMETTPRDELDTP